MGFFSRNRPKPKDAESDRMVEELIRNPPSPLP